MNQTRIHLWRRLKVLEGGCKNEAALECINKLLVLEPVNTNFIKWGIDICIKRGELDQAIVWCDKAIAVDPKHPEFHIRKVYILEDEGRKQEATQCYNKVVRLYFKEDYSHCTEDEQQEKYRRGDIVIELCDRILCMALEESVLVEIQYLKLDILNKLKRYQQEVDLLDELINLRAHQGHRNEYTYRRSELIRFIKVKQKHRRYYEVEMLWLYGFIVLYVVLVSVGVNIFYADLRKVIGL